MRFANWCLCSALLALTLTLAAACASAPPFYGLSDEEWKTLGKEELAAIPPTTGEEYFPEAVVYWQSQYIDNRFAREYKRQKDSAPVLRVETDTKGLGPRTLVRTEEIRWCVPRTDECTYSWMKSTVIFRQPIEMPAEAIGRRTRYTTEEGIMMEVTWGLVNSIVVSLKESPRPGECKDLGYHGQNTFLDDSLRMAIVGALRQDNYLFYYKVEELDGKLLRYRLALNGCYEAAEKEEALAAWIRAWAPIQAELDKGRKVTD